MAKNQFIGLDVDRTIVIPSRGLGHFCESCRPMYHERVLASHSAETMWTAPSHNTSTQNKLWRMNRRHIPRLILDSREKRDTNSGQWNNQQAISCNQLTLIFLLESPILKKLRDKNFTLKQITCKVLQVFMLDHEVGYLRRRDWVDAFSLYVHIITLNFNSFPKSQIPAHCCHITFIVVVAAWYLLLVSCVSWWW